MQLREGWEVLCDWPALNKKATRMMQALIASAGVHVTHKYQGKHRFLMLYGPGSPTRLPIVRNHVARGGHVAMWDLGYWDRSESLRLSIDTLHPSARHLAMAPAHGRRSFDLREDADPDGPILLIGLGPKSVFAYDIGEYLAWEKEKVQDLRRRFPGRQIVWRPKGKNAFPLMDLKLRHGMPIEEALKGCSLLVCRHSNTSVDACIAGVPVECEDGAAAALYRDNSVPSVAQREDFLARLTWWNWSRHEAPAAWSWVNQVMANTEAA